MAEHHYTLNGCYYTKPSIFPDNWKSGGKKTLNEKWRIQYYFYDPNFSHIKPYGKLCVVKGMNEYKNLHKRREVTKIILEDEISSLSNGYNPWTNKFMVDESIKYAILHPDLEFITAFRIAQTKINTSKTYKQAVTYSINHIEKVAIKMKLNKIKICDFKRRQLKLILDNCNLTDDSYNRHKAHISSLYNELVEYECCEINITRDIRRKQTVKKVREVLSTEDINRVFTHLKNTDYPFYRFAMIFMLSGSRISELLRIKDEVDLDKQEYRVTIKKGKLNQEVIKVIIPQALKYWKEALELKDTGDYLFSMRLLPGEKPKTNRYVKQKYKRQVKDALGITADFYTLKHSLLDSLDVDVAQKMASHTSSKTTEIYRVSQKKRDREELKQIKIGNFD